MTEKLKHTLFTPTDCISEQTMFDYIGHKLSPKEQHVVEKHLLECELCSDAMDGLRLVKNRKIIATINREISERMVIAPVVKKSGGFNYTVVMSAAAGLLLLLGGVFFFNHLSPSAEEKSKGIAGLKPVELKEKQQAVNRGIASPADSAPVVNKGISAAETEPLTEDIKQTELRDEAEQPIQQAAQNNVAEDREETIKPDVADKTLLQQPALSTKWADSLSVAAGNGTATNAITYEWTAKDADKGRYKTNASSFYSATKTDGDQTRETELIAKEQKNDDSKAEKDKAKKAPEEKKADAFADDLKATPSAESIPGYAPSSFSQNYNKVTKADSAITISSGFNYSTSGTTALTTTDKIAEFPGGELALIKFIKANAKWPVAAADKGNGATKIYLQFTVDKYGNVKNPKILKGIGTAYDKEALRVVALLPKWKPATSGNKPVDYVYSMVINVNAK